MNISYHHPKEHIQWVSCEGKILGSPVFQLTQLLPRNDKLIRSEYLQRAADGFQKPNGIIC